MMSNCPDCQKKMICIGTEKFGCKEDKFNWSIDGIGYKIMLVKYCEDCDVIHLVEPSKVFG